MCCFLAFLGDFCALSGVAAASEGRSSLFFFCLGAAGAGSAVLSDAGFRFLEVLSGKSVMSSARIGLTFGALRKS